jgi:hypothetical protein
VKTMPEGAEAAATVVDRFQSSLAKGNTLAAADLLFPGVLIFEGGAAKRSRDEYASHHLGADADFLKQAKVKRLARSGDALGDLAWVATESELTSIGPVVKRNSPRGVDSGPWSSP